MERLKATATIALLATLAGIALACGSDTEEEFVAAPQQQRQQFETPTEQQQVAVEAPDEQQQATYVAGVEGEDGFVLSLTASEKDAFCADLETAVGLSAARAYLWNTGQAAHELRASTRNMIGSAERLSEASFDLYLDVPPPLDETFLLLSRNHTLMANLWRTVVETFNSMEASDRTLAGHAQRAWRVVEDYCGN